MSLIAAALIANVVDTVQIGPITYRIQRINSHDLATAGGSVLLAVRREGTPKAPSPQSLNNGVRFVDSVLIAGVIGASADAGVTWEDLRFVASLEEQDADANRVWVGSLAVDHRNQLAQAVQQLSLDGGAADLRIASFLGAKPGTSGSGGETVRD